jgi:hypothetical protein
LSEAPAAANESGIRAPAQLFSLAGVLEAAAEIEADTRSKKVLINIPLGLSAGTYFIRLSAQNFQKIYTRQLVVL